MKAGSDINITCVVKGAIRGAPVTWYHVLPRDPPKEELVEINAGGRGGVQLVTDKNSGTSWLLLTHATWRDAGNYTCAPVHATPASVSVHMLDGSSRAPKRPPAKPGPDVHPRNTRPPAAPAGASPSAGARRAENVVPLGSPGGVSSAPQRHQGYEWPSGRLSD
ncbi:uncharacterized protein LOC127000130 [Eriocheir sinensis]|uniref:uncharacterized protein LOC127000130 n=1 Tax=Eriocheir sinensis TaxID=95602 RepID=UPI0021C7F9E8|nr:uncharacterized protein LOC127000130 [Eriocheir sinensis]